MVNKDNFNTDSAALMFAPEKQATMADFNSAEVDMANFESVTFYVLVGSSGDTLSGSVKFDATIEASATSGSGFAAVAATEIITTDATPVNTFAVVDAPGDIDTVYALGYKGNLQFVRIAIDVTGTHTNGTNIAIMAIRSNASITSTGQLVQSA